MSYETPSFGTLYFLSYSSQFKNPFIFENACKVKVFKYFETNSIFVQLIFLSLNTFSNLIYIGMFDFLAWIQTDTYQNLT